MSKKLKQITPYQATAILVNVLVGILYLMLPRHVTRQAGTGAWLAVLLGGLVAYVPLYLYTALGRRFFRSTLPEYAVKSLGLFFGGLLSLTFVAGWLIVTTLASRLFAEIVVTSVLTRVPLEVGLLVMLLTAAHLATQEVKTFARVNELLLPFVMAPLVVLLILSLSHLNIWRVLPPLGPGVRSVLGAIPAAVSSYTGVVVVSVFLPFYTQLQLAGRSHTQAIILVTLVYLLTVIAATGVFGVAQLAKSQWPTLELVRLIGLRGVLERLESPFLALYVITVFTTVGATFFAAVFTLSELFKIKSRQGWPYFIVLPLYYLALKPQSIVEIERVSAIFAQLWFGFITAAPLLILLVASLRRKEDKPDAADQAGS